MPAGCRFNYMNIFNPERSASPHLKAAKIVLNGGAAVID